MMAESRALNMIDAGARAPGVRMWTHDGITHQTQKGVNLRTLIRPDRSELKT